MASGGRVVGPVGGRPEGQAAQRDPETHGALGFQLSVAADSGPGRQAQSPEEAEGASAETPSVGRAPALTPQRGSLVLLEPWVGCSEAFAFTTGLTNFNPR